MGGGYEILCHTRASTSSGGEAGVFSNLGGSHAAGEHGLGIITDK